MACKHPNVTITEYGTSHTQHTFEGGRLADNYSDVGDYTGHCEAKCPDCGMRKSFSRHASNLPAWLRSCLEQIDG